MQKRSSDAKLLLSWLASAKIDWLNVSKIKAFNFYQQNTNIFYWEPAQSLNQEDSESQFRILDWKTVMAMHWVVLTEFSNYV